MTIYGIKCPNCSSQDVFMDKHASVSGIQIGIYCDRCMRWIKWANKQERRMYERNYKTD